MELRVELGWLLDFYGALLTPKRREAMAFWCEEDLSLSELGAQLGISRQAAADTLNRAGEQLREYEAKLGLLAQFRAITAAALDCKDALSLAEAGDPEGFAQAKADIEAIICSERGTHGL